LKTIGLLGGMSWESTALYYRLINEETRRRLGGLHSAPLVLVSVDFAPVEALQAEGDWDAAGELLAAHARDVQAAGADFLLLCTNTMHKVAGRIEAALDIPLLHLADATAACIVADGHARVGLLGTRFTMEQSFYRERLEVAGLEVLVPDAAGREQVHTVIYDELCRGEIRGESRERYQSVVGQLRAAGAECVVAGCTEITLLLKPGDCALPLYDTAQIHALAAVERALA
jgi:aspartate racemase